MHPWGTKKREEDDKKQEDLKKQLRFMCGARKEHEEYNKKIYMECCKQLFEALRNIFNKDSSFHKSI